MSISEGLTPKGGSLRDAVGTRIYLWWFGFRDRTGAFRRSNYAEGVAASRFQSHLIYLRTIWREVCNVRHRIALLRKNKLHRYGIPLQTPAQGSYRPHYQRRMYRQIRRRSIQTLLSILPEATLVDLYLVTRVCLSEEDYRREAENRPHGDNVDYGKTQMEPDTSSRP